MNRYFVFSYVNLILVLIKRVPGVSCGVVCVILRFAVLVEHRLVTDRQTRTDGHRPMASTADA